MASTVCVVGSLHMDLVLRAPRFVRPGETLLADSLELHPGGKGANQAVAASRMGAEVSLVGRRGDDEWGSRLRGVLAAEGVDLRHVQTTEGTPTGLAVVTVVPGGETSILVASGANAAVGIADVEAAGKEIAAAEVLLLQGELPPEVSMRAAELVRPETTVVLNAAPAERIPRELLPLVSVLVVNRGEAAYLAGEADRNVSPAGLARRLATLGPARVVVTLGAEGAVHFDGEEVLSFEGFAVETVDQTAAGDAFVGALAVLRAEGARLRDAVRFACAAGALATTLPGAIPSLPTRERIEAFLAQAPKPT